MAHRSRYRFFDGQRLLFFVVALLFAAIPTTLFANLLWRVGISQGLVAVTILFGILSWNVAWGATHSLIGFSSRLRRNRGDNAGEGDSANPGSVAIVLPVYNEDPVRVFAGLKTMYLSLQKTRCPQVFDFFVLSDSTSPERWVEEEHAWATLCRDLNAFGRINYRRRQVNTDKKAGNLLEFCESWGTRYRYMLTLDADSIVSGDTMEALYRRMEDNPRIGILQTAPKIVYAESFWGRLQQFANHFYGPVFAAGLNFWQRSEGNYWGHNAIIRMAPFMEHCALPKLPGREPFGGKILSHDFVEAALMQRAGFEVRLAADLEGSYEECPQDVIEHAKRDRRWCQGNMQHFWLLFSRGLTFASRVHLANGIMGYFSSVLWASFLIFGSILLYNRVRSQLTILPISTFGDLFDISIAAHSALVASITLSLLFLPKLLALLDSLVQRGRAAAFGGFFHCACSVLLETVCSALIAPVMMLYHAKFVIFTAFGKGVGWSTQKRSAGDGMSLQQAILEHWLHSLIGIAAMLLSTRVNQTFFYWMLPVSGSLAISPLISWLFSKPSIGLLLRRMKILATSEELNPSPELVATQETLDERQRRDWLFPEDAEHAGLMNTLVDPYINAIRATLAASAVQRADEPASELVRKALFRGPDTLSLEERKRLLCNPAALLEAHRLAWRSKPDSLHPAWEPYFSRYTPYV